ncbi:unnamed protein product [Polarella glacialis]|uniref:ADP,ATP carrier protein n=1 Tax=Polarella glacialis TaxID=89957 RepID=A0A813GJ10_POLGL|nr:unnamed protein product [Polarella glacialis]
MPMVLQWLLLGALFAGVAADAPPAAAPVLDADYEVACMLLGSVAFVMSLFYLLNHRDKEIKQYSWNVISTSICIFTGVHIGTAWNGMLSYLILGAAPTPFKTLLVYCSTSFGWYVALQLVLMWVSGAIGPKPSNVEKMVLNMKCWAVLIGITLGGSNLGLWGFIQQQVPKTLLCTALVVPLAWVIIMGLYLIGDHIRETWSKSDGEKDVYEEYWDKFAEITENGAACMAIAHLIVQVIRFSITGSLPLAGGQVAPGQHPTAHQAMCLLASAVGFAVLMVMISLFMSKRWGRTKMWMHMVSGNCISFCILYAMTWLIMARIGAEGVMGTMLLALTVTFVSIGQIFVLDYLADMDCTGEAADKEIQAFVQPLSLLIGFAWKGAFAASLTQVAGKQQVLPVPVMTLIVAVLIGVVVVPAWRWFILPVVMEGELAHARKQDSHLLDIMDRAEEAEKPIEKRVHPEPEAGALRQPLLTLDRTDMEKGGGVTYANLAKLSVRNEELEKRNRRLESELAMLAKELRNFTSVLRGSA